MQLHHYKHIIIMIMPIYILLSLGHACIHVYSMFFFKFAHFLEIVVHVFFSLDRKIMTQFCHSQE